MVRSHHRRCGVSGFAFGAEHFRNTRKSEQTFYVAQFAQASPVAGVIDLPKEFVDEDVGHSEDDAVQSAGLQLCGTERIEKALVQNNERPCELWTYYVERPTLCFVRNLCVPSRLQRRLSPRRAL